MKLAAPAKIIGYTALAAIVVSYSIFRFYEYWEGPTVSIERPGQGTTTEKRVLTVSGSAENIDSLSLNDREIFTNPEGDFRELVVLSPGYNVIQVQAADRFGRVESKTLMLMRDDPRVIPTTSASSSTSSTSSSPSTTSSPATSTTSPTLSSF